MHEWLHDNVPWIFSGAGVAVLVAAAGLFFGRRRTRPRGSEERASTHISAGRDVHVYTIGGFGAHPPGHETGRDTKTSAGSTVEALPGAVAVRFAELATTSIAKLPTTTNDILDLLAKELRSHPLLVMLDYESMPIPLAKGVYVVLSKLGTDVTVEMVSASPVNPAISAVWDDACKAYLEAYRLPFRSNQLALLRESEYRRSRQVVKHLLEQIQEYVYAMRMSETEPGYERLHRLKGEAGAAMLISEITYHQYVESNGSEALLGKAAIALDTAISCAHKILLQHGIAP